MDTYLGYLLKRIEIAHHLPLKDTSAYAGVCTLAHDAVYYVFSHIREFDFTPLLDDSGYIGL